MGTVGDRGTVECTDAAMCVIVCRGTCRVQCPLLGCDVTCGAVELKTACVDGFACGEAC